MQDPWLGEIALVAFNFAPQGWAFCNGQLMSINQNTALFSLLGTTYGGDGQTTFALPNLQSRVPLHFGQGTGLSILRAWRRRGCRERDLADDTNSGAHARLLTPGEHRGRECHLPCRRVLGFIGYRGYHLPEGGVQHSDGPPDHRQYRRRHGPRKPPTFPGAQLHHRPARAFSPVGAESHPVMAPQITSRRNHQTNRSFE